MKYETLLTTIAEAERFLERAKELAKMHKNVTTNGTTHKVPSPYIYSLPKEQGLAKRASMDLTRALADLRRGR